MFEKIIWMCWFQGLDQLDQNSLNGKCINRWINLNPDWDVKVLSNQSIKEYVPEFFEIIKSSPKRSIQAKSDLLRILLLDKFGGVWADASVFPKYPLTDFYDKVVNETGFFTYRFMPRGGYDRRKKCETVSWFLCTNKRQHQLIQAWKKQYIKNFKNIKGWWPYFTFHESLTQVYDSNEEIKFIVDNMVQINEKIPHSAIRKANNIKESFVYKRPNLKKLNEHFKRTNFS